MVFENFLTIDYIKTFLGTVIITMLIVQFFKELPGVKRVPTRYFTFLVAFFNILICAALTGTFILSNIYLMFINAILVTFTCTGGYDFTINNIKLKKTETPKEINPVNITNDIK